MDLKTYQSNTLDALTRFFLDIPEQGLAASFEKHAYPNEKGVRPTYAPLSDKGEVIDSLREIPYVAIRIPTGGGKTLLGAHFIKAAATTYLQRDRPLVVWLVPTRTIKQQTIDALKNPRHPYRIELDKAFGQVAIFDANDIDQINPQDLATRMCIVVATLATARVEDIDIRDFYAHKEALEPHFINLPHQVEGLEPVSETDPRPRFSFANLLRLHRPLVITDEAHNAKSALSGKLYERLAPSAIIELTATPDMATSNVLVRVSASQLFAEQMIKLPVMLEEHLDGWDVALRHALLRRQALEEEAKKEPDYIRPILLVQAEHAGGEATVDVIYDHLISEDGERIPEAWVKKATGKDREIDDLDLFAPDCEVRVIITMEALKEGWDCAFAYVLCSVSNTRSATTIEQLLGRVLRMPFAKTRKQEALNKAYAHVVSKYFGENAVEFTERLNEMGFSRLEAAQSIPSQAPLLEGHDGGRREEVIRFNTTKRPDLANVPAGDVGRIKIEATEEGTFEVEVTGSIQDETVDVLVKAVPKKESGRVRNHLDLHNVRARLTLSPAQRGETLTIPQLSMVFGKRTIPLETDLLVEPGFWNPNDNAGTLDRLTFDTHTRTWELNLGEKSAVFSVADEPSSTFLSGLTGDWREEDLIVWLDHKVRQDDVKQEAMVEWVGKAISPLKHKGYSLGQMVRGRFIIARQLLALLDEARTKRGASAYQRAFELPEVVVDPSVVFNFSNLAYPMSWPCEAPTQWKKHFYTVPGDLPYRKANGKPAEEYLCALAIEQCEDVEVWVRNLKHPTQFRLPTATGFTYPDFVARLKDGLILVLEYKGEDRYESSKNKAKRAVGELWARKNPHGIYLMGRIEDDFKLSISDQIKEAIADKRSGKTTILP